jgi:hypothetical protein
LHSGAPSALSLRQKGVALVPQFLHTCRAGRGVGRGEWRCCKLKTCLVQTVTHPSHPPPTRPPTHPRMHEPTQPPTFCSLAVLRPFFARLLLAASAWAAAAALGSPRPCANECPCPCARVNLRRRAAPHCSAQRRAVTCTSACERRGEGARKTPESPTPRRATRSTLAQRGDQARRPSRRRGRRCRRPEGRGAGAWPPHLLSASAGVKGSTLRATPAATGMGSRPGCPCVPGSAPAPAAPGAALAPLARRGGCGRGLGAAAAAAVAAAAEGATAVGTAVGAAGATAAGACAAEAGGAGSGIIGMPGGPPAGALGAPAAAAAVAAVAAACCMIACMVAACMVDACCIHCICCCWLMGGMPAIWPMPGSIDICWNIACMAWGCMGGWGWPAGGGCMGVGVGVGVGVRAQLFWRLPAPHWVAGRAGGTEWRSRRAGPAGGPNAGA